MIRGETRFCPVLWKGSGLDEAVRPLVAGRTSDWFYRMLNRAILARCLVSMVMTVVSARYRSFQPTMLVMKMLVPVVVRRAWSRVLVSLTRGWRVGLW